MRYKNSDTKALSPNFDDVKLTVAQYIDLKERKYLDRQIADIGKTTVSRLNGWKKLHDVERLLAKRKRARLFQ
ncbi:hypothetical protein [Jeotgalibacillus terrae]|uniref:Transposase n=1 Tax=Jeotgalibacillus terrae TaxID=587735 RepID=A0ABW5ZEN7_9BACL|nr:hypothetical protein [Jeotgalibacillus terrae]MBM7577682.1 hypothetical protein [Jeotgalibacillus terrae]